MFYSRELEHHETIYRYNRHDIVRILGRELKEKGFNLDMEMEWCSNFNFDTHTVSLKVFQQDRFRVRGKYEVIPSAII